MRDLTTFFQICIYITITMIIFTLAINFVVGLNIFPTHMDTGFDSDGTPAEQFTNLTGVSDGQGGTGMDALWSIVGGSVLGLGVGTVLGWAFHSTAILAVSIFSGVFWSAYISAFATISNLGMLAGLEAFIIFGSVGMVFIFAGAVMGMLSGSG